MRILLPFVLSAAAVAQSVLPPFDTTYQIASLGTATNILNYGGTAFAPNDPNVLLVSPYQSGTVYAIPLLRSAQGYITGFGTPIVAANVSQTDGGLAFGPNNVLFGTAYPSNAIFQVKPGFTTPNRTDGLAALGSAYSVGTCAFVPAGLPGAGRFKICSWNYPVFYDVGLTPDGNGTFALGPLGTALPMPVDCEGMVYLQNGAALLGGQLLMTEWGAGNISAYQIDAIGNPIPSTRTVVAGGIGGPGGGAVDPITGDVVFLANGGQFYALRNGSACGTYTTYGTATPGASGTPTLSGAGCARIGQTITFSTHHAANAIGLLALGYYQTLGNFNGLTVLQSLDVTVVSVTNGAGNWSLPIAIPVNALLGNHHVYLQAAYLDASTPSGFVASSALDVLIR